jgi:5-oxoprolinase (ATP-hydrolysing) subunit A
MNHPHIDLNADAGESFGVWTLGHDAELFALVSSVNLACGFHAGDPQTMRRAAHLAAEHGVAVGAHPGYPDRAGFGRRSLEARPEEIFADVLYQVGALHAVLRAEGVTLSHVKAHGALYLDMARDETVAGAVAAAVAAFDPALPLVALAGPGGEVMRRAAAGLTVVSEAFPDRAYALDGRLAPRSVSGGVLHDPEAIAARAVAMARGEAFAALGGGTVAVRADTLCLHGDHAGAVDNARAVRRALETAGIRIRPPR